MPESGHTVYVVTHQDHPDVEPFVFANQWDAIHFVAVRWPADGIDAARIMPQSLIDHDLALEMIADEKAD